MKIFQIFLVFYLFGLSYCILPPYEKIDHSDAPFFVFLYIGPYMCGGTLIQPDIVLTAAHCIDTAVSEPYIIEARLGSKHSYKEQFQQRSAKSAIIHENYSLDSNNIQAFYDIGLILLDSPPEMNNYVGTIEIGTVNPNDDVTVYGYGSTDPSGKPIYPYFLLMRNTSIIDDIECQKLLQTTRYKVTKQCSEICFDVSVCMGDSGGPLVQKVGEERKIVGIISWGADDIITCNKAPDIAVKVADYYEWIEENIERLRSETPTENENSSEPIVVKGNFIVFNGK